MKLNVYTGVWLLLSIGSLSVSFYNDRWLSVALTACLAGTGYLVFARWSRFSAALAGHYELVQKKSARATEFVSHILTRNEQQIDSLLTDDPLGIALVGLQNEMHQVKEEETRRAWMSNGLAMVGDILSNKQELEVYTQNIICHLVRYLNANQGGLYIEQQKNGDRVLELTACYAYSRKKHIEQCIGEGQGILGQCMLEKDFVFITDVPGDYVKITSGLGEALPRNIVVAPLLFKGSFEGAIELALFDILKPHQVDFLKKVCENIAAELASIKAIENTKKLLQQANGLTHELRTKEEAMTQNLEELAATQEEMASKQAELTGLFDALNTTLAIAEIGVDGNIISANEKLADILQCTTTDLTHREYSLVTGKRLSWQTLMNGNTVTQDVETSTWCGEQRWLNVSFTPIKNKDEIVKVLCLIHDVTDRKEREREFEQLSLVANNTNNSVIITDDQGITVYVNPGFTTMTGYQAHEILGKKPGALLQGPLSDKATISRISASLKAQESVQEEILNYTKSGKPYWVSLAINPVMKNGSMKQFISIQTDITDTKIKGLDFVQKMEALGKSNAILEIDPTGNIIDVNENYLHLLGYERGDLVHQPYNLITHKPHVFDKLIENINTQGIQKGEYTRFHKDGTKHCMRLMDYPVVDYQGNLVKIIEFGSDVTQEKHLALEAERKKAELNSYLQAINNTIASAEFDAQGHFTSGNDIFMKVMGYTNGELLNARYDSLLADSGSAHLMWENLQNGKFFSGEYKIIDKRGNFLWMTGTFNPTTSLEGHVEKITMLAQFTTQEKERFIELTSMVQALKATLPVLEFNELFECKAGNEKALKLFGISRMQVRSMDILSFIDPGFHALWSQMKNEIASGEFLSVKLPVRTPTGSLVFEASVSVSRNLEGRISRIVFLFVREVEEAVSVWITG